MNSSQAPEVHSPVSPEYSACNRRMQAAATYRLTTNWHLLIGAFKRGCRSFKLPPAWQSFIAQLNEDWQHFDLRKPEVWPGCSCQTIVNKYRKIKYNLKYTLVEMLAHYCIFFKIFTSKNLLWQFFTLSFLKILCLSSGGITFHVTI